jgi:hypothetical protein
MSMSRVAKLTSGVRIPLFLAILFLSPLLIVVALGPITGVVASLLPLCANLNVPWTYWCTYTWSDGSKYVGEFKDNSKSGQGTFIFANGDKYIGEFKDDRFDGQGTYVSAGSGNTQSGIWKNGELVRWNPGVPIEIKGDTFIVSVMINGKITLNFTIDSGAADVSVPSDVVSTLIRTGSITKEDFLGEQQYQLADGSVVPSATFIIRSLKVGDKVVENVKGSVAPPKGILLLGQSFLNRFNYWSIDNRQRLLFLN